MTENDKPRHRTIFDHGDIYLDSSNVLSEASTEETPHLIFVAGVLKGLALELYFKALHRFIFGETIQSHWFYDKHYTNLPEDIQHRIEEKFYENLDHDLIENFEAETGQEITTDFENAVKENQKIFTQLRYIYDTQEPMGTMNLPPLIDAVRKVYLEEIDDA